MLIAWDFPLSELFFCRGLDIRVPQIVEPDAGQSRVFQDRLQPVVGIAGIDRLLRMQRVWKDPLADGCFLAFPQTLGCAVRQGDGAPALVGFGLPNIQRTGFAGTDRPDDLQGSICLVEVLPLEAADLTPAQAGGQFGVEEVPPYLILLNGLQKGVQLRLVQDLLGPVVGFGNDCALCRILGDQVCALGVLHGVMEHGVDAGEHGVRELVSVFRMLVDASLPLQPGVHPLNIR